MLYRGGVFRCNGVGSARRPRHVTAGQHMEMQVLDSLAGLIAAVVDDAVALCAQLTAQLGDDGEAVGHHSLVALVDLGGAADMLLGHHQEMHGSLRLDVVKGVAQLVLVQLLAGDLPVNDGAEQAVILHGFVSFQ